MTLGCNIWMICLILIWFFYGLRRMFQLPQFVWALRSSVWDVFINFLLIDATDRSKIISDQKRFFIALSLYLFNFSRTLPLINDCKSSWFGVCVDSKIVWRGSEVIIQIWLFGDHFAGFIAQGLQLTMTVDLKTI